ncbi:MAG: GrlR family regulatory protein [Terracidiphilus sp.]
MEGIWYAHFTSGELNGVGVAVLHNGQVEGGDPAHTYSGSYQEEGNNVYANVRVSPYAGSTQPADLTHPITYFLRGSVTGDLARVSGHPNNKPEALVSVELRKGE